MVEWPFPETSEVRDTSKAGRCFDSPERSDSKMVDNSVLRGGSGLNVTTGGPRSTDISYHVVRRIAHCHHTYLVPHAQRLTRMEEMAPGRRRQA